MHSYVMIFGLGDPAWLDPAFAGGIFALSVIVAFIFGKLLYPLFDKLTTRIPTDLDAELIKAVRRPITLGIVVLGGYLALTIPLDIPDTRHNLIDATASILGIWLGVMAISSVVSVLFNWYSQNYSFPGSQGNQLLPVLRKVSTAAIYVLGGMMVLNQLGINISPLIAGLGLGGFAVALGLQPTLANLFAGTYVMTEGVVNPGDYIQLEDGTAGYVIEVSWRTVRIRTWSNNLVVIPNSRFSTAIVTNYQRPVPPVNIYMTCGVSYDSDLFRVQEICQEVMNDLLERDPNAVKEYGAYFGFEDFGDSNINFWLFLQAKDRLASFEVRSALIQGIHGRFMEEGIVINYPVRTLYFGEDHPPEDRLRRTPRREPPPGVDVPGPGADTGAGDGPDFG